MSRSAPAANSVCTTATWPLLKAKNKGRIAFVVEHVPLRPILQQQRHDLVMPSLGGSVESKTASATHVEAGTSGQQSFLHRYVYVMLSYSRHQRCTAILFTRVLVRSLQQEV